MQQNNSISRRDLLRGAAAATVLGLTGFRIKAADAPGKYQLGCYTRPWAKFDYRVALDGIAESGYRFAGLMTTKAPDSLIVNIKSTPEHVATVAAEVKKRGLRTISIYCGPFNSATSVEAGIAGLRQLIDYSAVCECPNLLLGGTDEKGFDAYYKAVAECCDYAAEKNVGLSVKPHGGKNANGAECRKIIEMINHPNFRIWYDAGNIFYYSDGALDPVDDAPSVDGLVAGMAVKDFLPPKVVDITPGTGQVNFPEVMARLAKGGFTHGPLVVECLTPQTEPAAINAEARKAREFLVGLLGADRVE